MFHLNMHYWDMRVRIGLKQLTVPETGNPNRLRQKIPERNCNRYHGKNRDQTVTVIVQLV